MSATTERRDRELRELVQAIMVEVEAIVALTWDRGFSAGERFARAPLARRRAGSDGLERLGTPETVA